MTSRVDEPSMFWVRFYIIRFRFLDMVDFLTQGCQPILSILVELVDRCYVKRGIEPIIGSVYGFTRPLPLVFEPLLQGLQFKNFKWRDMKTHSELHMHEKLYFLYLS